MQAGGETSEPLCGQEYLGSNTTWVRWPMTYKCACSPQINVTFDDPYQSTMVSLDTSSREHSNYLFTHWQAWFKSKHLIPSHPRVLTSHYLTFPCFPNGPPFMSLGIKSCFTAHPCKQCVTAYLTSQQGYWIMSPSVPSSEPCPESLSKLKEQYFQGTSI